MKEPFKVVNDRTFKAIVYRTNEDSHFQAIEPHSPEHLYLLIEDLEKTGYINLGRSGRMPVSFWVVVEGRSAKTLYWKQ